MLCLFSQSYFFYMIKNKQRKFYEFSKIRIFIPVFTVAYLNCLSSVWPYTRLEGDNMKGVSEGGASIWLGVAFVPCEKCNGSL